jgi:hypothetical protein
MPEEPAAASRVAELKLESAAEPMSESVAEPKSESPAELMLESVAELSRNPHAVASEIRARALSCARHVQTRWPCG